MDALTILILIDIVGSGLIAAGSGYVMYRYLMWKADRLLKQAHPDEKNGLNLNVSYKIDGSEVFGVHSSGVDLGDMIHNMTRWFGELSQKKDDIVKENIEREKNGKP